MNGPARDEGSTLPALSVIIASATSGGALERCLGALLPQTRRIAAEVIVADATGAAAAEPPEVVWMSFPTGTSTPDLWGAALERARGGILAVLDGATVPGEGWAEAVMASVTRERPIIGGAVEPLLEGTYADWTAYFTEYAQFMRPLARGVASELPGNNIAFRRDMLGIGPEYNSPSFWKTYWCGRLAEAGIRLHADPAVVVWNAKRYRLGAFLRRRYRHGRCFGGMRVRGASWQVRAVRVLAAPLVPIVLLGRVVRNVWPKGKHRMRLLFALPGVLLSTIAWAIGEGIGSLAGPGDTCSDLA